MIERPSFDDLYPPEVETESGVFRSVFTDRCVSCGRITYWVSIPFEAHVCSPVCEDATWAGYEYARAYEPGVGLRMKDWTKEMTDHWSELKALLETETLQLSVVADQGGYAGAMYLVTLKAESPTAGLVEVATASGYTLDAAVEEVLRKYQRVDTETMA